MVISTFSRTLHMMYKQLSAPMSGRVGIMEHCPFTGGSRILALNVSFLLCCEVNIPLLVFPSSGPSGCSSPHMTLVLAACDWSQAVVVRVSARSPERPQWTDGGLLGAVKLQLWFGLEEKHVKFPKVPKEGGARATYLHLCAWKLKMASYLVQT